MRKYGVVAPAFWTGPTGKLLKQKPHHVRLLAVYLITSPHANMIGLYYLPWVVVPHESGLTQQEAQEGIGVLGSPDIRFAEYDFDSEMVWVPEMARYQIGERLKRADNNRKAIENIVRSLPKNPFTEKFYDRYEQAFNLSDDLVSKGSRRGPEPLSILSDSNPSDLLVKGSGRGSQPLPPAPAPAPVPDPVPEETPSDDQKQPSGQFEIRAKKIQEKMQFEFDGFFQGCLGAGSSEWLVGLVKHFREPEYPDDQIERGLESMHEKFKAKGLHPPAPANFRLKLWEWITRETVKRKKSIEEEIEDYHASQGQ